MSACEKPREITVWLDNTVSAKDEEWVFDTIATLVHGWANSQGHDVSVSAGPEADL